MGITMFLEEYYLSILKASTVGKWKYIFPLIQN